MRTTAGVASEHSLPNGYRLYRRHVCAIVESVVGPFIGPAGVAAALAAIASAAAAQGGAESQSGGNPSDGLRVCVVPTTGCVRLVG